jgi:uncharacterized protein (TIGR03000 family)
MKFRRFVWALCVAAVVLGSLAGSSANAWGRRAYAAPNVAYYNPPPPEGYGVYYPMYVAPLPGYGILPPPWDLINQLDHANSGQGLGVQPVNEPLPYTPRKRASLFPAVPYEQMADERRSQSLRVRYEITVPFASAAVLFDGVKTKQTGLTRIFVSSPMQEEKEYTSTITVEWAEKDGTPRARSKTFTFRAGDTVKHTFIE